MFNNYLDDNFSIEQRSDGVVIFMPNLSFRSPERLASEMKPSDMEKILNAVGGDFSKIDPATAAAMSLFAADQMAVREDRNKAAARRRQELGQALHETIMSEIFSLMEGSAGFRTCDIQIAAAKAWRRYAGPHKTDVQFPPPQGAVR